MKVSRPRGTYDLLPEQTARWHKLESMIRDVCTYYGYGEIRTPVFEHTELFERGIGEATDIVEKEMYTFEDRGQRSLTLRPEGTAPVVRSFLENKLYAGPLPAKLYYYGPMFRYERPQAGRYRQFYQFGIEAIGSVDPSLDVEMIILPIEIFRAFGLAGFEVHINSIGCPKCRDNYRQALRDKLKPIVAELCGSCQSRFERNPLRILDCKVDRCCELTSDLPAMVDYLCPECQEHFAEVTHYLELLGVSYQVNPRLVRGFDYYTKTVFEIQVPSLGAQNAIAGGGRYDGLVEEIGGNPLPAVGFAAGMERVILAWEQQNKDRLAEQPYRGFIAQFGGKTKEKAIQLAYQLRSAGISVELDYLGKSLRAQMKAADRLNAAWVIVIGESELESGYYTFKSMNTGEERQVATADIVEYLRQDEEVRR